jgi:hypothetical protein
MTEKESTMKWGFLFCLQIVKLLLWNNRVWQSLFLGKQTQLAFSIDRHFLNPFLLFGRIIFMLV